MVRISLHFPGACTAIKEDQDVKTDFGSEQAFNYQNNYSETCL